MLLTHSLLIDNLLQNPIISTIPECVYVCVCARAQRTRNRGGGQNEKTAQKSSGLLVMGFGVILIFFFKLLSIFKIFNDDYVLLFELEKKNHKCYLKMTLLVSYFPFLARTLVPMNF